MLLIPLNRCELCKYMPQAAVGAEIGVSRGEFSRVLLAEANPERLHLIDPWEQPADLLDTSDLPPRAKADNVYESVLAMFASERASGRVVVHRQYSQDALAGFADEYFDWVYIDGAHDEVSVARDLAGCAAKMKPGGLIFGHDYTDRIQGFGVVPAVNRFVRTTDWNLLLLTIEDIPTFVLAKDLEHPRVRMLRSLLYRLVPGMVELRNDPLDSFRHRTHTFEEGGCNIVMSFGRPGLNRPP
ncbi:MAG: class I SAM-dependent methyltransferase [Kiritimatiellae bacterium]|nr:class I SAM-dependent methyltransferase [Kiritimatiellia bacterium]